MSGLPQTQEALRIHYDALVSMRGEHPTSYLREGMDRSPVGYAEFDPAIHSSIDPLAPLGIVTGEDYVRLVEKEHVLQMSVVADNTRRRQHPEELNAKHLAARRILGLLTNSMPEPSDITDVYDVKEFGRPILTADEEVDSKVIAVGSRAGYMQTAANVAKEGFTILVSDFQEMRFSAGALNKAIAVKVNHIKEVKHVPEGRMSSLGAAYEVQDSDPAQVNALNEMFEQQHNRVVGNLMLAGAEVVTVVVDPNNISAFDVQGTDSQLAAAIKAVSRKA